MWRVSKLTKLNLWGHSFVQAGDFSGFIILYKISVSCAKCSSVSRDLPILRYQPAWKSDSSITTLELLSTIYPELFVAYRLLVFILVLNLRIYLFYGCMERTEALLTAQAKPADVWNADMGTEEECWPYFLVCQSLKRQPSCCCKGDSMQKAGLLLLHSVSRYKVTGPLLPSWMKGGKIHFL